ncbi:DUF4007 family protein [Mangrovimonas sp. TPBH4]|uniref:DUF4007 family protein n=1 Tax=Mangrovimonas sp. TPBH4 TaxID=1645914 RepID=UPI0006B5BC5F|nr:DUF4007 family protein [Mangrovimonas sp. TPBH4]
MTSNSETLRFSGHDTFHCKEQWILKGLQLIENQNDKDVFRKDESISLLGVGKNMVRSIQYWLRAFGLIDDNVNKTEIADLLFITDKLDPYLESEGSLWLLQYLICKCGYASIYKLIFADYFSDKATREFSEFQVFRFIDKELRDKEQKNVAEKTLVNDYKVFIRTYVAPIKNHKTVEDDFNVPLLSLNLISNTGRKNDYGQSVYCINKGDHNVPVEVFAYCLMTEFEDETAISFDDIRISIGAYLCLSDDKLDMILNELATSYKEFVFKDDAGVRQIQLKKITTTFKHDILKKYYELY